MKHIHFDGNVGCQILQDCADLLTEHKLVIEVCTYFLVFLKLF